MRKGSLVLVFGLLVVARSSDAAGTRTFDLDTLEEFSGGDLKGVAVSSDGAVRAGWSTGRTPLTDASASFSGLLLSDGSFLVGTSPGGKIWKVQGDKAQLFADTKELAVTSLLEGAGGAVYAGTIPDGKIYKVSQGKAEIFATLPDTSHVWALAWDKTKSAMYAAVGPDARILRVDTAGKSSVYFRSDEPNLVSVAVAANGDVYAGSSGKGLLYRITAPSKAQVVFDSPGEELKGIAFGKGETVFAIANEYGEPPEPPKRPPGRIAGPTNSARPKPGKGFLFRFDASGRPEKLLHHDEFHYTALAVDDAGKAYVGTGAEGRVYSVEDDTHVTTLMLDTDERQVGAIAFGKGGPFIATSDPAALHRVTAQGGPDAVWTSKVFDAGLRAKYGHLSWRATGALELATRTGNSGSPDATWSGWSALQQPGVVTSPAGRFVQVRARWKGDAKATLSEVLIPFVTENVRPVVLEVAALGKSVIPGTKEGVQATGGDPPKHDATVHVTWKVDNPDSDALRYRLQFRREEQATWRELTRDTEVLTKTEYDWDTIALAEGKYRVRVEASDEPSNAIDAVQKHALESQPVLVDNTPPVITAIAVAGRRLTATVSDGVGPLARAELAVDGRPEWRAVAPVDGLFDTATETIAVDLGALLAPGSHIVALRVFDAAGNSTIREVETK